MLVLTRKRSERIIIGNREITISIISIDRNDVRIGIDADKKWSVHREEVFDRIKEDMPDEEGNK